VSGSTRRELDPGAGRAEEPPTLGSELRSAPPVLAALRESEREESVAWGRVLAAYRSGIEGEAPLAAYAAAIAESRDRLLRRLSDLGTLAEPGRCPRCGGAAARGP